MNSGSFKLYALIGFCFLNSLSLLAQESNLTEHVDNAIKFENERLDTLKAKSEKRLQKVNELKDKPGNKFDSLKTVADNRTDSIKNRILKPKHKLDSIAHLPSTFLNSLDTLKPGNGKLGGKADSLRTAITGKMDSVSNLRLPTGKLTSKLDSVTQLNPVNNVNNQLSEVQNKLNDKLSKPEDKVNEKLSLLTKEAGGEGNLPTNVNAPDLKLANPLKNVSQPGVDLKMPEVDNPLAGKSETLTNELKSKTENLVPDLSQQKEQLKETVNPLKQDINQHKEKINDLKNSDEVLRLKKEGEQITTVTDKAKTYEEEVKNLKEGKSEKAKTLRQDAVNLTKVDELQQAQTQLKGMEEQTAILQQMKNKEAFKKQTLAKGREMVVAQLATQHASVQATVAKVSTYQKKAGTLFSSVKGLPKRPLKAKKPPFIERFVPGITTQVQKSNLWLVDLNPSVRFRLKSILSIGTGWNERIAIDNSVNYHPDKRVYGIRSFSELTIKKGLSVRIEAERMSTFVPLSFQQQDQGGRKWVWSYLAGMRKDFSFAPGVLGNVQFMYNLYNPKKQSPYMSRFNVRFGFEFPLKKTHKKL